MKTRSAFLKSPWKTQLRDIDLPDDPPPGKALIRIEACGICGTDLSAAETKAENFSPFGHEIAGVIARIDPSVKHLKQNMPVVLESSSFCGHCDLCRDGRVDLCAKAPNFWGNAAMGFSDFMLAPLQCIVPYDGLTPEVACLAEPAGVAVDMVKTADIQLGERVCLVGLGPIGLMAIPLILRSGAAKVVCIAHSHSKRRLEMAAELGGEVMPLDAPLDSLKELSRQFDHVLLTAPVTVIPQAIALLRYGGRLTYIGIGAGKQALVTFDANDFHFRKLQLRASMASPAIYYPTVLRLLQANIIPGEKLISHRFALEEIGDAMETCRRDKASVLKVVIKPERNHS